MKTIFYKTVRSDGSSLFAPSPLGRVYTIGEHYEFPDERPAFGFPTEDRMTPINNLENAYLYRRERWNGNRVLICYGKTEAKTIKIFGVGYSTWNSSSGFDRIVLALTSVSFDVIGEIFVPKSWVESEDPKPNIVWNP